MPLFGILILLINKPLHFRYGSKTIGGIIDNCQLTDWPFYELDPRYHFVPELGFEVYDRGSYGHGCEPDHFGIRGHRVKIKITKADQCKYISFIVLINNNKIMFYL